MAVFKIEYFSKEVKDIVKPDVKEIRTRYDNKMRLRMENDKLVVRNLKKRDFVAERTNADIVHTIDATESFFPESVANKYYGDPRLYWIILAANNMSCRNEFLSGINIIIPSKRAVYGNSGVLLR